MIGELPVSPKGWGVAIAGGLMGVTVFGLQHIAGSPVDGVLGIAALVMAIFAFMDAYLIASGMDDEQGNGVVV